MLSAIYASILVGAFLASSIAFFGPGGIVIVGLVAVLAAFLNKARTAIRGLLYFGGLVFAILFLLFLFVLLSPPVSAAREAALRMQCMNNLKQIALALLNYQEDKKSLPPPYVTTQNGKPIHSWRVLILPYMDGGELYKQYNFNEPWDGANNRKLLDARPPTYACSSAKSFRGVEYLQYTNYIAVVGRDRCWSVKERKNFLDGPLKAKASTTIMLVETDNTDIPWTEPKDFGSAPLPGNALQSNIKISSRHANYHGPFFYDTPVVNVAMADAAVRSLPIDNLSSEKLASLLTIGGCRPEAFGDHPPVNWPNCFVFAAWLASTILLLHLAVRGRKDHRKPAALPELGPDLPA